MREPATSTADFYDELEPAQVDSYRDAALEFVRSLNATVVYIIERNCSPVAVWSVAFGLGLDVAISKTETEIASGLDVTRAELSRQVKLFQRMVGLPPNAIQKSPSAVASYHRTRSSQLT